MKVSVTLHSSPPHCIQHVEQSHGRELFYRDLEDHIGVPPEEK